MPDKAKGCIAVSACLLGHACRYDGKSKPCQDAIDLGKDYELIPICPEVEGGLPIPHPPCEIVRGKDGSRVVDSEGSDVTEAFYTGASICLRKVKDSGCFCAVMKAKSPSCGSGLVYDGTFSSQLASGWGVAAAMLRDNGIKVLDETHIGEIKR